MLLHPRSCRGRFRSEGQCEVKRIQVNQIRLNGRPLWPQWQRAAQRSWTSVPDCAYRMVQHGPAPSSAEVDALLSVPTGTVVVNRCGETDGSITSLLVQLFDEFLKRDDLDLIAICDDDGEFVRPEEAMRIVRDVAERHPKCDALGPMSAFYAYHKYHKQGVIDNWCYGHACLTTVGVLDRAPWAFWGCQIYTRRALQVLPYRMLFEKLKFWHDYALALDAHRKGLRYVEVDLEPYWIHPVVHKGHTPKAERWTAQEALDQLASEGQFLHAYFGEDSFERGSRTVRYRDIVEKMHKHMREKRLAIRLAQENTQ